MLHDEWKNTFRCQWCIGSYLSVISIPLHCQNYSLPNIAAMQCDSYKFIFQEHHYSLHLVRLRKINFERHTTSLTLLNSLVFLMEKAGSHTKGNDNWKNIYELWPKTFPWRSYTCAFPWHIKMTYSCRIWKYISVEACRS